MHITINSIIYIIDLVYNLRATLEMGANPWKLNIQANRSDQNWKMTLS